MKKHLLTAMLMAVALFLAPVALCTESAQALSGDGASYVYCNGRYTIANKYWGSVRMSIYGCNNGFVYAYVTSGTNWAKGVGITRSNPSRSVYADTTGKALYSVTSPMLAYPGNSCYTASGWSMDANYGANQNYRWCR